MVAEIRMYACKATKAPKVQSKSAFTMIELIFAIVIIGISILSLPMMTQATSKGIEGNLVQEAIFAASAELNQVLSYQWDENAMDGNDTLAKVAWTSDCNITTKLRAGHINQPLHRKCVDDSTKVPTATLGVEGLLNDIDDNIKTTAVTIFEGGSATTSSGYKNDYRSTVSVEYSNFGDQTIANPTTIASQNMKKITVTIKNNDGNIITLLKTYSANIGEIDYYKRSYQ